MTFSVAWFHSRRFLMEWLSLGLALLIFGGYMVYTMYEEHRRIDAQERERLSTQVKVVADNLGRQLNSSNLALESVLSEMPDWMKQKDGTRITARHLKALADAMPGVRSLIILDVKGTVVSADKIELVGRNFAHREYFQTVLRNPNPGTLYVSPPFMTTLGNFTINLIRMVPGPQGQFDGIVIAALDPEEFKVLLDSVLYAPDMRASLIHGDGTPFWMAPHSKDVASLNLVKPGSFFAQHLKSGQKASVFTGTSYIIGDERMVALRTLQPEALSMDKPLVIAVGRDLRAVFTVWNQEVSKNSGLFAVLALFAILSLYFYQRRLRIYSGVAASYRTEHQRSVEALRQSEDRFRSLTRLSSDWYWEQDDEFRFVRLEGKLDQRTSSVNEAHVGKTRWEMGAINLTEADWEMHRAALQTHQEFHDFEMLRTDKGGNLLWTSISGLPIFDAQEKFCGYRGVARDITEHKLAEDAIKRLAFYDILTQLPNRRLLNDRLGHAFAASKRSERYGALMFIDLDKFKPLNDAHGHEAGDLLLIEVAHRITHCVREVDTVARFGGDEFAVILSELDKDLIASKTQAGIVAEKIRTTLAEPYILKLQKGEGEGVENTVKHHCTASIGAVLFMNHEASQEDIFKWADLAMYQAKEDGRNLFRFYESKA